MNGATDMRVGLWTGSRRRATHARYFEHLKDSLRIAKLAGFGDSNEKPGLPVFWFDIKGWARGAPLSGVEL